MRHVLPELEEKASQGSVSTRLSCGNERGRVFNGLFSTTLRQRWGIRSLYLDQD
jgi:hypothetical protein